MDKNLDDIVRQIKANSYNENKSLANELKAQLGQNELNALNSLLGDKDKLLTLTQSDAFKNLLQKFGGDSNGYR